MADGAGRAGLRVVIDARLESGRTGGTEGVVLGLAHGLSQLEGAEEYLFLAYAGHEDWLRPYLSGTAQIVVAPEVGRRRTSASRVRKRVGDVLPPVRDAWRRVKVATAQHGKVYHNYFVEDLAPDVIHQTTANGFITRAPTIFHPHDLQHVHLPEFFTPEQRAWRERRYGFLCRQAEMVAVVSEWTRRDVIEHFELPSEKVRVVPLAPPLAATRVPTTAERREARARLRVPERYALYPAQTWAHKNHIRLLEAIAILRDRDGLVVPLVASGRQNDHFAAIAEATTRLGLNDQVTWTGFVDPLDLQCLFLDARAVVIPTLFEAASGPLWEAFESGVPAACSNVTSLPEQAGDAAVIFEPTDPAAIADAIARVWTDEELRRRLVAAGRERVASLSWVATARIFRAHYRRLAGAPLSDEDRSLVSTVYR